MSKNSNVELNNIQLIQWGKSYAKLSLSASLIDHSILFLTEKYQKVFSFLLSMSMYRSKPNLIDRYLKGKISLYKVWSDKQLDHEEITEFRWGTGGNIYQLDWGHLISLQIPPSCYYTSGTISLPKSTFLNLWVSEGNEGCSKDNFLVLMFYYKIIRIILG